VSRFLIVDDDLAVASTLSRMLSVDGHTVTAAPTAEAGLDLARLAPPDAVLVDLRMPSVSGVEFLRRLRRDPALRELPVAVVTGDYFLEESLLAEIHSLGATVQFKPLWLEDVLSLARSRTGRPQES
jgi:CheY-like chemotaxis protein